MKVFISHSSADKPTAHRLDADLRRHGIDTWLDAWEIKVGDSIIDKINQGIAECSAFLILVSRHSVASRWVREELNAATLRRILEKAKILPLRIDDSELPSLLAPMRHVDLRAYEESLEEVLDVLLDRDRRPHVAARPSHGAATAGPGDQMLTGARAHILARTAERANADRWDDSIEVDEAMAELRLSADEYAEAVEDLADHGLIYADRNVNHPSGYSRARLKPHAFVQVVGQIVEGVDVEGELRTILERFARSPHGRASSTGLLDGAGIPEPRAMWFLEFLHDRGLIVLYGMNGVLPLGFDWGEVRPAGRRILRGQQAMPLA